MNFLIGHSVMGQPITAYIVGDPAAEKRVLVTGGMHAREWITALAVGRLIEYYETKFKRGELKGCIAFVPLCNPDGVRLAMDGMTEIFAAKRAGLIAANNGSADFSLWKANANAVDINVNFDAEWGNGKANVFSPAPADFVGPCPESEPETRALVDFARTFGPAAALAFHSKGEVVYFSRKEDKTAAEAIARLTSYTAVRTRGSFGGLTDWLALRLGVPSFTVEVGGDELPHPIGQEALPKIFNQIKDTVSYFLSGA